MTDEYDTGHDDPDRQVEVMTEALRLIEKAEALALTNFADDPSPRVRLHLAQVLEDAVSEIEDDLAVAWIACEGLGGEERHPHTSEALQDLSRALKRLSHEAGLSVAEVRAEPEQPEEPEEAEHG